MGNFQPLNAVRNRAIVDPSGEHVGYIHDVLFDLRDGRIEYVCIVVTDQGEDEPCEAVVPWSAVRVRGDDAHWEVAARKSILDDIAQPVSRRN
jgi:sporulation protein YlmC with PRC-barrel domain